MMTSPQPNAAAADPNVTFAKASAIGCGSILLVMLIGGGAAVYVGVQNIKKGRSTNPEQVRAWLQDLVPCEIPAGYDAILGVNAAVLGARVRTINIAPPGSLLPTNEFDRSKTVLMVMEMPRADDLAPTAKDTTTVKEETVELTIAKRKVKATRRELEEPQGRRLEFQAPLRKNVLFLATGPAEGFDGKAMAEFLKSLRLDLAGDLPTAVKDADKTGK